MCDSLFYLQAHTFQAILVVEGSTTFVINNYCSDNEDGSDNYPRFALADGRNNVVVLNERNTLGPVQPSFVLGQDDTTREGQYVFRSDTLHCFDQDQFYCVTGNLHFHLDTVHLSSMCLTVLLLALTL